MRECVVKVYWYSSDTVEGRKYLYYIVTVYVSMHGIDSERVCSKSICKYGWRISRQIKQADEMNLCEGYRMSMIVCG